MRVAVLNITASGMSGGYKSYLRNILPLLAADSRIQSVLCASLASLRADEWIPHNHKLQFTDCPPFSLFRRRLSSDLERTLSSFCPDIIFVPTARAVRFRDVPVVTMVLNMAPLGPWKWYGLAEWPRLAAQRLETFRAVKRAQAVIAISDFVRQFLLRDWRMAERRVVPIYFGAPSPSSRAVRPSQMPPQWTDFVLAVGSIEPYRSLEDVIRCAEYSRKELQRPLRVVLVGAARESMRPYERRLRTLARKLGVSNDLCWIRRLSDEEMVWCYKNSSAFVMTSRVEAGPNTVLEAMACGSVSIAADNAPLPEFFSETALYYAPGDGAMLAHRIKDVFSWDAETRAKVSAAARERAREFTWERAAAKTINLFEDVALSRVGAH